jgi:hypothetical protein
MEWTEEAIQELRRLREVRASPARAALALKCNKAAVKAKARELGMPFPHLRTLINVFGVYVELVVEINHPKVAVY